MEINEILRKFGFFARFETLSLLILGTTDFYCITLGMDF